MPRVPFTAWLGGPTAIYTSPTGQSDPITGLPYLGTDFQNGYFADLSADDAKFWNQQYSLSAPLNGGRYRIVRLASDAVAADILPNLPVGWASDSYVGSVGFTPGTGYTPGTYTLSSSSSGSQVAAVASVTVGSSGAIISATVVSGGQGFVTTTIPTFSLTALGGGSGGAVTAQLASGIGVVTSLSSVAISVTSLVRGIALCSPGPTTAQITAGAWIIIQELGIAPVLMPASPGSTTAGAQVIGVSGGTTQTQASAYSALELGRALVPPVASQIIPVLLTLPEMPL